MPSRRTSPNVERLHQRGDVAGLVAALGDEDPETRERAAIALGELGKREAVEPLLARLHDDPPAVRGAVVRALHRLGDPRAAAPLAARMRDDRVRTAVLEALVGLGEPAVSVLIQGLADGD